MAFADSTSRDAFGYWLSGFTDGEGCFLLSLLNGSRPGRGWYTKETFTIALRRDDAPILESIKAYLGCGGIAPYSRKGSRPGSTVHMARFQVTGVNTLCTFIIPHFDRYPLLAKKANDYAIWRQAVLFHKELMAPRAYFKNGCRMPLMRRNKASFTPDAIERYKGYCLAIKECRKYRDPATETGLYDPPKTDHTSPQKHLFD